MHFHGQGLLVVLSFAYDPKDFMQMLQMLHCTALADANFCTAWLSRCSYSKQTQLHDCRALAASHFYVQMKDLQPQTLVMRCFAHWVFWHRHRQRFELNDYLAARLTTGHDLQVMSMLCFHLLELYILKGIPDDCVDRKGLWPHPWLHICPCRPRRQAS